MKPLRVLVADDHALVRAGIRALLENRPGIEVVGEAADARAAIDQLETLRPAVVLMDLSMPGLNGIEGTARIVKEHPKVRILILSAHTDGEHVSYALHAGAAGYLVKDSLPTELETALRAVARGECYLSPAVAKHAIAAKPIGDKGCRDTLDQLTPRLREVLQLVAEGKSTKEIARLFDTSPRTVDNQRAEIMRRLDLHDLAGLIRFAVRHGLINIEQ